MAAKFGATIVPFGVIGEDDICEVSNAYGIHFVNSGLFNIYVFICKKNLII